MKQVKTSVTLLIPDLLDGLTPELLRQQMALTRLMDRADATVIRAPGFEQSLVDAFYHECRNPSLAWLSRLGEHQQPPAQGAWLRADPVHMAADIDNVLMFGNQDLNIRQHESDALIDELNRHFQEQGWRFFAADPRRWYLQLAESPQLHCSPLSEVIGQNVRELLPGGQDSLYWHRTINEIQMLLYQSPVNLARREAGDREINSIWFWGDGEMKRPELTEWCAAWGDDVLLRGLAIASGTGLNPLPDQAATWQAQHTAGRHLLVLSDLGALAETDREQVLHSYELDWFAPLLSMLLNREVAKIEINPCNGTLYRVTRGLLARFWRRSNWLDQVV